MRYVLIISSWLLSASALQAIELNSENRIEFNERDHANYRRKLKTLYSRDKSRGVRAKTSPRASSLSPRKKLSNAIRSGNCLDIEKILNADPELVNQVNNRLKTPLIEAIHQEQTHSAITLLQLGASQSPQGPDRAHPFVEAAGKKNYELMSYFLSQGTSINVKDGNGNTAVHRAARLGDVKLIRWLSKQGAKLEIMNDSVENALEIAVIGDLPEVILTLTELGVQISYRRADRLLRLADQYRSENARKVIYKMQNPSFSLAQSDSHIIVLKHRHRRSAQNSACKTFSAPNSPRDK